MKRSLQSARKAEEHTRQRADQAIECARNRGAPFKLDQMCERYGLSAFERNVVLLGLSTCFSKDFDWQLASVGGRNAYQEPSVQTILAFHELNFSERLRVRAYFTAHAPLRHHNIINLVMANRTSGPRDILSASVSITHPAFNFLLGDDALGDEFLEFSSIEEPLVHLDDVILPTEDKTRIMSFIEHHDLSLIHI